MAPTGSRARRGGMWGVYPVTMTELLEGTTAFYRRGRECFQVWAKLGPCRGLGLVTAEDGRIVCAHLQGRGPAVCPSAGRAVHAAGERSL